MGKRPLKPPCPAPRPPLIIDTDQLDPEALRKQLEAGLCAPGAVMPMPSGGTQTLGTVAPVLRMRELLDEGKVAVKLRVQFEDFQRVCKIALLVYDRQRPNEVIGYGHVQWRELPMHTSMPEDGVIYIDYENIRSTVDDVIGHGLADVDRDTLKRIETVIEGMNLDVAVLRAMWEK